MGLGNSINQMIKDFNQQRLQLKALKNKKQELQTQLAALTAQIDAAQIALDALELQLVTAIKALP